MKNRHTTKTVKLRMGNSVQSYSVTWRAEISRHFQGVCSLIYISVYEGMKCGAVQWETLPVMCHGGSKGAGVSKVLTTKYGNKFHKTEDLAKIHTYQSCTTKNITRNRQTPLDFNSEKRYKLSSLYMFQVCINVYCLHIQ